MKLPAALLTRPVSGPASFTSSSISWIASAASGYRTRAASDLAALRMLLHELVGGCLAQDFAAAPADDHVGAEGDERFAVISLPRPVPPPVTRMRCDLRMPSLNTGRSLSAMLSASIERKSGRRKARPREDHMASVLDRFRLDGQVAVITGGARGIGRATAEAFVAAGARAVLLDRDLDEARAPLRATRQCRGARARRDQRDRGGSLLRRRSRRGSGRIDILVNNAGASIRKPTTELSKAEWDTVIAVNQTAVFLCSRAAARHMLPAQERRDRQSRLDHGVFRRRALPEHLVSGEQGRGREHDARDGDRMGEGRHSRQRGRARLGAHRPSSRRCWRSPSWSPRSKA